MARIRINTRTHTKEKPYLINSYFVFKLVRHKKSIGWAKYMYVCEWNMSWSIFCNFSLVTKKCEKQVKIPFFSNERYFETRFPKKKTITFFWSKLSKLHKKHPILHVTTTFSLKQGETRTNSVPIPHPLTFSIGQSVQCCQVLMWRSISTSCKSFVTWLQIKLNGWNWDDAKIWFGKTVRCRRVIITHFLI